MKKNSDQHSSQKSRGGNSTSINYIDSPTKKVEEVSKSVNSKPEKIEDELIQKVAINRIN